MRDRRAPSARRRRAAPCRAGRWWRRRLWWCSRRPAGPAPARAAGRVRLPAAGRRCSARPAINAPVAGSWMSPTALTAISAATCRPSGSSISAVRCRPSWRAPGPGQLADRGAGAGADAAILDAVVARRDSRPVAAVAVGRTAGSPMPRSYSMAGGHNRHARRPRPVADALFVEVAHHPVGRGQTERAAARTGLSHAPAVWS